MTHLAIYGTITFVPGKKEQLLAALKAHGERSQRDEPGTLTFEVLLPRDDETRVMLYEVYRDDAAFETHRTNPSIARFREETAGIIVSLDVARFDVHRRDAADGEERR